MRPGLISAVRAVAFSPGGTLLAAAGDACAIALYDVKGGAQVANLLGHGAWVLALDWSHTGEYLLSGYDKPFSLFISRASFLRDVDDCGAT